MDINVSDSMQLDCGIEVVSEKSIHKSEIELIEKAIKELEQCVKSKMKLKDVPSIAASTIFYTNEDKKVSLALTMKANGNDVNFEVEANNNGIKTVTTKIWDKTFPAIFSTTNLEKIKERALSYVEHANVCKLYENNGKTIEDGIGEHYNDRW